MNGAKRPRREASNGRVAGSFMAGRSPIAAVRSVLAEVPTAARVCALLAFANAVCWSLIIPPFQVLDEPDHFAYVQQLAENGSLPTSSTQEYSPEETLALQGLNLRRVSFRPEGHPIWSRAEEATLQSDLAQPVSRRGTGATGFSASEPPLYYALQTIPYSLASSGTILERLQLMRLMSSLMGALTALFAFMFLREALPGARWSWTVGALGVALAPLLGLSSGGVTPDAMLFAVSTALFYCVARAFRRGLTRRSALAIGALVAVGLVTKLNFVGLVPGAVLGLILLAIREARGDRRAYARLLGPALAVAASPVALYALVNLLSNHPAFGIVSSTASTFLNGHASQALSYIWQFYLPRLPWMHADFGGSFTTQVIWFRDLVGRYGWNDTVFPHWAYDLALIPLGLIAALCVRALVSGRAQLRRRSGELLTYTAMSLGMLILVGASGYLQASNKLLEYTQPRYMLPMVALWGAVLALAARGAGRRWGPVVGVSLVVLVLAHDVLSQLQVIARYYG
jgi:4-amino-4-deoxy-L-arabinose transferase-like glycosyltransferase